MRSACAIVTAVVVLLLVPLPALADDVAVVVNKSSPIESLSMAQLRKILLAQEGPDGKKVTVYMAAPGQPDRGTVLKTVLGMSETDFNLQYMHASFNGNESQPPKVAASAAQAKQAVAAAPGTLAFIHSADVDTSVKVVKITGIAPGQPGYPIPIK
jgi:hypothetical protein